MWYCGQGRHSTKLLTPSVGKTSPNVKPWSRGGQSQRPLRALGGAATRSETNQDSLKEIDANQQDQEAQIQADGANTHCWHYFAH